MTRGTSDARETASISLHAPWLPNQRRSRRSEFPFPPVPSAGGRAPAPPCHLLAPAAPIRSRPDSPGGPTSLHGAVEGFQASIRFGGSKVSASRSAPAWPSTKV